MDIKWPKYKIADSNIVMNAIYMYWNDGIDACKAAYAKAQKEQVPTVEEIGMVYDKAIQDCECNTAGHADPNEKREHIIRAIHNLLTKGAERK